MCLGWGRGAKTPERRCNPAGQRKEKRKEKRKRSRQKSQAESQVFAVKHTRKGERNVKCGTYMRKGSQISRADEKKKKS